MDSVRFFRFDSMATDGVPQARIFDGLPDCRMSLDNWSYNTTEVPVQELPGDPLWPWAAGCIIPMLLAALSLVIPFLVCEWLIHQDWCKPYLITYHGQPRWREPDRNAYSQIPLRDLLWKAFTKTGLLAVGGALVLFCLQLPIFHLENLQHLPGVTEGTCQFLGMFLVIDFFTYAAHWAFHKSDFLWKHVHAFHHHVHTPTALATTYATFWDSAINGAVPFIVGAAIVQPNPLIFYANICFFVSNFVVIHSGIDAPWLRVLMLEFLPFRVSARLHDKHHKSSGRHATNLGTLTTFWDWPFGTLE
jgi:sterol desaturase/sphingolipid hydroxylase (fatty acid hydroxylase superfamily)